MANMFGGADNNDKCPFCSKRIVLELWNTHLKECAANAEPGEVLMYLQKTRHEAFASSPMRGNSKSRKISDQFSRGAALSSGSSPAPTGSESFSTEMQQNSSLGFSVRCSDSRSEKQSDASKTPTGVSLGQDVTNMFVDQKDCDIIISCKDSASILCHKFMLQARCPLVLRKLWTSFNSESKNIINLKSFSVEVVRAFLFLVYSGDVHGKLQKHEFAELEALCDIYKLHLPKKATTLVSTSDATRSAGPRAFTGLTGYSPGCVVDLDDRMSSDESSVMDTSDDPKGPTCAKNRVAMVRSPAASSHGVAVPGEKTQINPTGLARNCGVSKPDAKKRNADKPATGLGSSGDSLLSDLPEDLLNNHCR